MFVTCSTPVASWYPSGRLKSVPSINVHASPSPPTAVVEAVVVPTSSPSTVSNVTFNTVSVVSVGIASTTIVCPAVDPNGTSMFVTCSTPVASWYPFGRLKSVPSMNVHASPSPPTAVVEAVAVPTFVPSTVSNVTFNTVSVGIV